MGAFHVCTKNTHPRSTIVQLVPYRAKHHICEKVDTSIFKVKNKLPRQAKISIIEASSNFFKVTEKKIWKEPLSWCLQCYFFELHLFHISLPFMVNLNKFCMRIFVIFGGRGGCLFREKLKHKASVFTDALDYVFVSAVMNLDCINPFLVIVPFLYSPFSEAKIVFTDIIAFASTLSWKRNTKLEIYEI